MKKNSFISKGYIDEREKYLYKVFSFLAVTLLFLVVFILNSNSFLKEEIKIINKNNVSIIEEKEYSRDAIDKNTIGILKNLQFIKNKFEIILEDEKCTVFLKDYSFDEMKKSLKDIENNKELYMDSFKSFLNENNFYDMEMELRYVYKEK